ncbi:uncharacterized protein I303_101626 [Kwoniella dejecticola CBS 10117]|uniref:Ricin B lectin domain-containing protein n=1 Tax=Kwoniella dejecticola CBS 10117 TaxID=1296121 RepID=A0A1A6AD81_9TREE|nr:uncharacterized protein I303_02238 [Kwoniella dejecticola CBS 10117]OBR88021.1 hypothetical protein I303_02238 [Kwoniella dejecticola CBS 10117]
MPSTLSLVLSALTLASALTSTAAASEGGSSLIPCSRTGKDPCTLRMSFEKTHCLRAVSDGKYGILGSARLYIDTEQCSHLAGIWHFDKIIPGSVSPDWGPSSELLTANNTKEGGHYVSLRTKKGDIHAQEWAFRTDGRISVADADHSISADKILCLTAVYPRFDNGTTNIQTGGSQAVIQAELCAIGDEDPNSAFKQVWSKIKSET